MLKLCVHRVDDKAEIYVNDAVTPITQKLLTKGSPVDLNIPLINGQRNYIRIVATNAVRKAFFKAEFRDFNDPNDATQYQTLEHWDVVAPPSPGVFFDRTVSFDVDSNGVISNFGMKLAVPANAGIEHQGKRTRDQIWQASPRFLMLHGNRYRFDVEGTISLGGSRERNTHTGDGREGTRDALAPSLPFGALIRKWEDHPDAPPSS